MANLEMEVRVACERIVESIKKQIQSRAVRVANEMKNAELEVMSGERHGRRYRVPGTRAYYTASAPGEPPAVRTGNFRNSWQPAAAMEGNRAVSKLESGSPLADMLENGTSKMAPRPHQKKILETATPKALAIYNERYV